MKPSFSNLEVIKFAIGMEESGIDFYVENAKAAKGEVKELFLRLADDERQHAAYFQKLFDESTSDVASFDYMFDESVTGFFNEYAKSEGFNRNVDAITTVKEAIAEGIKSETITIEYYENIMKYSKEKTKKMLEVLIKEEQEHLVKLQKMYALQ